MACEVEIATLRVLVADDRADVCEALRLLLKSAGHQAETVDSPPALLRAAESGGFDLILMDLNYARDTTSGQEGLELLAKLHERRVEAPVIVMTAWGNVDLAVEAMRRGACDFIQKPWDNARLLSTLQNQAQQAAGRRLAEQRARSELEIARNVQQKLFPHGTGRFGAAEYAGCCLPAREVGGDYYDFLEVAPGRMAFLLADVSGKGVAAALLMANLQGCFRSHAALAHSPAALLATVNRLFFGSTPPEQYATAFLAEYSAGRLRWVNCGHPAAMLLRAGGRLERLEATATVLGAFSDWSCEECSTELGAGDTLVVFSDGLSEAGIEEGTEFGEDGLEAALRGSAGRPVQDVVAGLIEAARSRSAMQSDDITVVGVRG